MEHSLSTPTISISVSSAHSAAQVNLLWKKSQYSTFSKCSEHKLCRFHVTLSDQETVKACAHNGNTECRCKQGAFCDPDEACEVCKKCSR